MPTIRRRYVARRLLLSSARSWSSTSMRPAVGRSRPPRRLSSVDLPEPDLPSRATFSPRRTSSETPRRAQTRTDFPDVHSFVTSVSRTAGEVATRGVVTGEKRDISGASWGDQHLYAGRREESSSSQRNGEGTAVNVRRKFCFGGWVALSYAVAANEATRCLNSGRQRSGARSRSVRYFSGSV